MGNIPEVGDWGGLCLEVSALEGAYFSSSLKDRGGGDILLLLLWTYWTLNPFAFIFLRLDVWITMTDRLMNGIGLAKWSSLRRLRDHVSSCY